MAITSDIPTEPPPDRALFIGARLFVAGDAFFFLGFLFAYLYLRALNSNGLWHPPHTNPSGALATVSLVAVVAAAVIVRVADDRRAQVAAAVATVLVLVAAICEGVQLFDPGFSPIHAGGYGAVFVGFTAGFTVHLLGAAYWLETIAADRTTRGRPAAARTAGGAGVRDLPGCGGGDRHDPLLPGMSAVPIDPAERDPAGGRGGDDAGSTGRAGGGGCGPPPAPTCAPGSCARARLPGRWRCC